MNLERLYETIDFVKYGGKILSPVEGYDIYFLELRVFIRRDNEPHPIRSGYYCFHRQHITGEYLQSLSETYFPGQRWLDGELIDIKIDPFEERIELFQNEINKAKAEIMEAAIPYILDGCFMISNDLKNWINLDESG